MASKTISLYLAHTLTLTVWNTIDNANNRSRIDWTLTVSGDSYWYDTYVKITINGVVKYNQQVGWNGGFPAQTGTYTGDYFYVEHNNDGTKSIPIALEGYVYSYSTSSTSGTLTCTATDRTAPAVTTTISNIAHNSCTLNVTSTSGIASSNGYAYQIKSGSGNYGDWAYNNSGQWTISNLTPNTTYTINGAAKKSSNNVWGYNTATFTTLGGSDLSIQNDVTAITFSTTTNPSLTFEWTPLATTFSFKIVGQLGSGTSRTIMNKTAIASTTEQTQSYTFQLSTWQGDLVNSPTGTLVVTLETYNGNTLIGSSSKNITVTFDESIKPSIASITLNSNNAGFGTAVFLKGRTTLQPQLGTVTLYGASVSSVVYTIEGARYNGSTSTNYQAISPSTALATVGTGQTITVTLTDSRGRSVTKTSSTFTVYDYNKPVGNISYSIVGNSLQVEASWSRASIMVGSTEKNTASNILVKLYKNGIQVGSTITLTNTSLSGSRDISSLAPISSITDANSATYTLEITVPDGIYTDTSSADIKTTVTTGVVVISRLGGGNGVTFFQDAQYEGFWVRDIRHDIVQSEYLELARILSTTYDSSLPYDIGIFVTQDGSIYECNTVIASGEAWNVSHWDFIGTAS